MSASLELKNVEKAYGPVRAVSDFNLSIAPGEFVTFLGPSGSGKTTALKMISGFETPTKGEILLDGQSIVKLPPFERGIGMVFQNYALFPHMTVAENVAFPLTVRRTSKGEIAEKMKKALALIKMENFEERYPSQLSGGQQQRIALARAIVFNPRILLMDEPLGALDRNLREHMKIEIMRIQKELDITIVFVTHDQDEALTMSDRIAVMRDGRLEQVANSKDLYYRPENRFVAQFLGESNLIECRIENQATGRAGVTFQNGATGTATVIKPVTDGAAWLFIRPEHLVLSEKGSGGDGFSTLEGTVTRTQFLGEATRYDISCGPLSFTVKRQNQDRKFFETGRAVTLSWQPENALIMD